MASSFGCLIFATLLVLSCADKQVAKRRFIRDAVAYEEGTTPHFENIFLGRCFEHGCLSCTDENKMANCQNIYNAFLDAVLSAPNCELDDNAYDTFISMVAPNLPEDMTAFWSGTYDIAHELSSITRDFYTMEDSFMGYLVDGLNWCGNADQTGLGFLECPSWDYDKCYGQATSVFWNKASATIAAQARGEVSVVLNGDTTEGAFRDSSFFARVEAPNLDPAKVTKANILLVHELGSIPYETCDEPITLINLWSLLEEKGIEYSCTDNPEEARFIQCSQDPDHAQCASCEFAEGESIWEQLFRWF